MKVNSTLLLMSVSIFFILLIPMNIVTGDTDPPESVDYGDIVALDHVVYSDETMETIIIVEYEIIINVSKSIEWHSGLIGLTELDERAWLLNTPVKDCVHWVYIRAIHAWYPVPPTPPEPLLDMIINGILSFASENLIGMIISVVVIIYLLSKVLLR